jgi:hypothetical protein
MEPMGPESTFTVSIRNINNPDSVDKTCQLTQTHERKSLLSHPFFSKPHQMAKQQVHAKVQLLTTVVTIAALLSMVSAIAIERDNLDRRTSASNMKPGTVHQGGCMFYVSSLLTLFRCYFVRTSRQPSMELLIEYELKFESNFTESEVVS